MTMNFHVPAYPLRKQLWEQLKDGEYPLSSDVNLDVLANTFHFTGGQI